MRCQQGRHGIRLRPTKRVPENQRKLGNLLALLAQLQQRCLARGGLHELRYPLEDAPVLFRHADLACLRVVRRTARNHVVSGETGAVVASDSAVVLLLGGGGGSSSSLGLCLCLCLCLGLCLCLRLCLRLRLELAVLGYMMVGLLVVALLPLARVLLLMREDVLHWLRVLFSARVLGVGSWRCCRASGTVYEIVVGSALAALLWWCRTGLGLTWGG